MEVATNPIILDATGQRIAAAIEALGTGGIEIIAEAYDQTASYSVGDVCSNYGKIWKCNTAIAMGGESWTPAHWNEKTVAELIAESVIAIDATPTSGSTNAVQSGGVYTALAGKVNTDGTKVLTPNPVVITASSSSAPSDTTALWVYPAS